MLFVHDEDAVDKRLILRRKDQVLELQLPGPFRHQVFQLFVQLFQRIFGLAYAEMPPRSPAPLVILHQKR